MMIGAILNTIFDPIFIFVFHWGVEGAAVATVLSQLVGLLCNAAYLFKFKTIQFGKASLVMNWSVACRMAGLGFASCFNNLTSTVVAFVSNNLLTKYGALSVYGPDIPLTTFGLCMKVSMIAFSVGIGVASGSQPIIGFNYGAQKYDRVKKTFILSAGVLFQAIGQPVKAAVASLSKQLLFYIPAMLILSRIWGLTGILMAGPTADILAFILCIILCFKEVKKYAGTHKKEIEGTVS